VSCYLLTKEANERDVTTMNQNKKKE